MKALYIFLFISLASISLVLGQSKRSDQYVTIGVQLSGMTFMGDVSSPTNEFKDFLEITRGGIGLNISKRLLPRLSITTSFNYGRLYGDDNLVAEPSGNVDIYRYARNLHFRNDIIEGSVVGELDLFPQIGHFSKRKSIRPYVFGGIALLSHNPEARTPTRFGGTWVSLRELGTEGQNLGVVDRYAKLQFAFISGFGFNLKISERADIGIRFGYRQTYTDYLDDVGGKYIDPSLFGENELARAMADRSLEPTSISTGQVRNIDRLPLEPIQYVGADGNTYETINGYFNESAGIPVVYVPRRGRNSVNDGYWVSSIRFSYIISTTKKNDALSKVYQINDEPSRVRDEPIADDFLKHRERYEVIPLVHLNTAFSEIPTGFYKDGILIDSDRPEKDNESGRSKGNFYNIYYTPFADMKKGELLSPVTFSQEQYKRYNRISAVEVEGQDKVLLAMFPDLGKSRNDQFQTIYEADVLGENLWTDIQRIPFNNMGYSLTHPSVSADGEAMYLVSDMPGGYGGTDIYVSYFFRGQWTIPQNLGPAVNTSGNEVYPFIHKDGTLYFASDGHDGLGGLDIYEAVAVGESFVDVINVGAPINSPYNDFGLILNDVKRTGYFSSNRIGGFGSNDIYQLQVKAISKKMLLTGDEKMEEVREIRIKGQVLDSLSKEPVANAYVRLNNMVTNQLEVKKSDRKGRFSFDVTTAGKYEIATSALGYKSYPMRPVNAVNMNYDVEEVEVALRLQPNKIRLVLHGTVKDKATDSTLVGKEIKLIDIETNEEQVFKTNVAGKYIFSLKRNKLYRLLVGVQGYEQQKVEFSTRNKIASETFIFNFDLE